MYYIAPEGKLNVNGKGCRMKWIQPTRPVQKVSGFIFSRKNQSWQVGKSDHSG
jgi:hypothetical protein